MLFVNYNLHFSLYTILLLSKHYSLREDIYTMNPIKPKYIDTIKANWRISKRSNQIINQYSKYTKYDEGEIIDKLIADILVDKDFIKWLNDRRYQKKIQGVIFDDNETEIEGITQIKEGDSEFEETQKDTEF